MTPESEPERRDLLPIDRHRELIVVDPSVVGGALADNGDAQAPFSFRAQMQWLAGASREPLELTRAWLSRWESASMVGPDLVPVTPRARVRTVLVDPWAAASSVTLAQYVTPEAPAPEAAPGDDAAASDGSLGEPPAETPSEPGYGEADEAASDEAASGDGTSGEAEADEYGPDEGEPSAAPEPTSGYPQPGETPLSWGRAPFRLIAIVNRVDLAGDACSGFAGELRYVYAAADPRTSRPLDLTLIIEVPYPATRPAAGWARAWKDLAALPPGAGYAAALAALTREIQAEADPLRVRLRTNEAALSEPGDTSWEMREFQLQIAEDALELVQVPLELTPRADADPAELSAYVLEHAQEIERAGATLPENLRGGVAAIDAPDFSWDVLGVSERLRRAFSVQTCNGCHGGDTATLPFRHIGASASFTDPAELSRFLYDPDAPTDELRRRSAAVDALSATECAPAPEDDGYTGG